MFVRTFPASVIFFFFSSNRQKTAVLITRQLMSRVDLRESLGIMCQCQVPGTLLHKNRWSQGQSSSSSSSSPLLYSLQFPYLAFFSLSLQSSSLPFPEHTRERLFGQLAVISSWFGSLCSFDQTVAPRQKPERMRVQLWLGHSLNWARRPEEKEEEGGGEKKSDEKEVRLRRGREGGVEAEGWGPPGPFSSSSSSSAVWVMNSPCWTVYPCYSSCGPS